MFETILIWACGLGAAASFIAFILRHQYPDKWSEVVLVSYQNKVKNSIRNCLTKVSEKFLGPKDEFEMYLE